MIRPVDGYGLPSWFCTPISPMTQPYSLVQMPVTVANPMVMVLRWPPSTAQKSRPDKYNPTSQCWGLESSPGFSLPFDLWIEMWLVTLPDNEDIYIKNLPGSHKSWRAIGSFQILRWKTVGFPSVRCEQWWNQCFNEWQNKPFKILTLKSWT